MIQLGSIVAPTKASYIMYDCQGAVWDVRKFSSTGHTIGVHFPNRHSWSVHGPANTFDPLGITYFQRENLRVDRGWTLKNECYQIFCRDTVHTIINRTYPFRLDSQCDLKGCSELAFGRAWSNILGTAFQWDLCREHYRKFNGLLRDEPVSIDVKGDISLPNVQLIDKFSPLERTARLVATLLSATITLTPNPHPFLPCAPCDVRGCRNPASEATIVLAADEAVEIYTCREHFRELHGIMQPLLPPLNSGYEQVAYAITQTRRKIAVRAGARTATL